MTTNQPTMKESSSQSEFVLHRYKNRKLDSDDMGFTIEFNITEDNHYFIYMIRRHMDSKEPPQKFFDNFLNDLIEKYKEDVSKKW